MRAAGEDIRGAVVGVVAGIAEVPVVGTEPGKGRQRRAAICRAIELDMHHRRSSMRETNLVDRHRSEEPPQPARTARWMDDCSGRSPDLRVVAPFRLPEKLSGVVEGSSPLTVAGAAADLDGNLS